MNRYNFKSKKNYRPDQLQADLSNNGSVFSAEHVYLHTPNISKENIIGTNVGIRPFRKTGVRIEAEQIEDKLIIHNYGHGGSGFTLSFGGVQEVLEILANHDTASKTVAILGAGVVGLTAAYDLLEKGYEVQIYSDKWSPNLTSNVAAGIWSPLSFPKDLSEEKKQLHLRMQKNSECRFLKSIGEFPEFIGVRLIPSYSFENQASPVSDREKQKEEIIAHFDNGVTKNGRRVYELGIDGQLFMNDLYLKVKQKGARLRPCHFESLEDVLTLNEPIIINCTSMGSIKLFNDQEFIPVRGQLVYFNYQQNIDYLYFHDIDTDLSDPNIFFVALYPWSDRMILGGVYEQDKQEPVVSQDVIDKIIKNAELCLSGIL
ncbi:MAG: FAD-dependent oxidoreductase [Chlamydiales bacterium]